MNLPGYGDPQTWPACTNHPNDPRTDGDGREEWESNRCFVEFIDGDEIEEILTELLYGKPEIAKFRIEKSTESAYQKWLAAEKHQAEEDLAADRAENRDWEEA